jgi:hypothetical protein
MKGRCNRVKSRVRGQCTLDKVQSGLGRLTKEGRPQVVPFQHPKRTHCLAVTPFPPHPTRHPTCMQRCRPCGAAFRQGTRQSGRWGSTLSVEAPVWLAALRGMPVSTGCTAAWTQATPAAARGWTRSQQLQQRWRTGGAGPTAPPSLQTPCRWAVAVAGSSRQLGISRRDQHGIRMDAYLKVLEAGGEAAVQVAVVLALAQQGHPGEVTHQAPGVQQHLGCAASRATILAHCWSLAARQAQGCMHKQVPGKPGSHQTRPGPAALEIAVMHVRLLVIPSPTLQHVLASPALVRLPQQHKAARSTLALL